MKGNASTKRRKHRKSGIPLAQPLCRNRHAERAIRARHPNIPCLHCTRLITFRRAVVTHIWEGVLPAVTTKFNADFSIDRAWTGKNIEAQIDAGVDGDANAWTAARSRAFPRAHRVGSPRTRGTRRATRPHGAREWDSIEANAHARRRVAIRAQRARAL